jgi:hypothetical protein
MLGNAAGNARQRVGEPGQPARFARLAHALPFRMIAVLQTSGRVAANRLDVGVRIGRVQNLFVARRNSERDKAALLRCLNGCAIRLQIAEAAAMPLPADGQFGGTYVFQSEPFDELCGGRREPGLIARRAVALLLRSLLLHGKRNKLAVDLAIAGLSFCSGLLLDWPADLAF